MKGYLVIVTRFMLMNVTFAKHLRMGAGCHEPALNRGLEPSVPHLFSGEVRAARG